MAAIKRVHFIKPRKGAARFKALSRLAEMNVYRYLYAMNWLTKQEQWVICVVIGLLVTGLFVKYYRAAHPPAAASESANP